MTWGNFDAVLAERLRKAFHRHFSSDRRAEWTRLQQERCKERLRIAQELHDTLLQGFLSASLQLCLADQWVPADSPAKPVLRRALNLMRKVIDEGRAVVLGLRSPELPSGSLEKGLCDYLTEFGPPERARVSMTILGQPRRLDPAVQEHVYRITCEALLNALNHSQAKRVELEIEYLRRKLRVTVRDNGVGIDPKILQSGEPLHWGLAGMRERAVQIGARFRVWSKRGQGTEVEMIVPLKSARGRN